MPREGDLRLRCPFCGDSENPSHKHFRVNLSRMVYYCFRCGVSGQLPLDFYTELITTGLIESQSSMGPDEDDNSEELPELVDGAATTRFSKLTRFKLFRHQKMWDAFKLRDPIDGDLVGVNLRRPGESINLGEVGLAWCSSGPLLSSPDHPIYLVEGAYDVIRDDHVATLGFITSSVLKRLFGHHVVLVPDGDIWTKPLLGKRFIAGLQKSMRIRSATIVGIDLLPEGKDPDEVAWEDRIQVRGNDIHKFIREAIKEISDGL